MKSNDFAQKLNNDYFGIEFHRFVKIVTGLRGHGYCGEPLYPDARTNSGITAVQVAHLLRVLALNYNPFSSEFHLQIAKVHTLRDYKGIYFTDELARLLRNPEEIKERGLMRVSFSQDRDSVVMVFCEPFFKQALKGTDITHYVAKEQDQVFGESGLMKFERFAILKQSALLEIAALVNKNVLQQ